MNSTSFGDVELFSKVFREIVLLRSSLTFGDPTGSRHCRRDRKCCGVVEGFDSMRTCVCRRYKVCVVYIIGVRRHDVVFVAR